MNHGIGDITTRVTTPSLTDYWSDLSEVILDFPAEQQRTAVAVYRELSKGEPTTIERVASALSEPQDTVAQRLAEDPIAGFLFADGDQIVGFGGLAAAPMHHEFVIAGRQLWTWCAWDSLFIPTVLGQTAEVASPDPETGTIVRLTVSPQGIEEIRPRGAVVSFLLPETDRFNGSATNVMASFCHHVFFFESSDSGERWRANRSGTFLYPVEEAFRLGQRLVRKQFGQALEHDAQHRGSVLRGGFPG